MAVNRKFSDNYSLGGGELYIKLKGENNFKFFGQTLDFKLKITMDKLEHKNSEGAIQVADLEVVKETKVDLSFNTEDLRKEILALAFNGSYETTTQDSGSVTDQEIAAVEAGAVYELGKLKISNVSATYKDGDDDITMVEDVDYSYNAQFGEFEIAVDSPAVGHDVKVSYDYAEVKTTEITSLDKESQEVTLKFLSNAQVGKNKKTIIHKATLTINGDYDLKNPEKIASLAFNGKVLKDDTQPTGKQFFVTTMIED